MKTKNRLKLDWALTTSIERANFINNYITSDIFANQKPTTEELETMANYVLWGKDSDGLNSDQRGEIEMPRKYSTWASQNIDSLDEKTESPTFTEASVFKLGSVPPTRKPKEVFSREKTRESAPPQILPLFEDLWEQIDHTDLLVGLYEERTGKRDKPPRTELLQRFSEDQLRSAAEKAELLNQHKYLKLKHLLVELRREQYTLRDAYLGGIVRRTTAETYTPFGQEENASEFFRGNFEEEIPVFPLGTKNQDEDVGFWRKKDDLFPENFGEEETNRILKELWKRRDEEKSLKRENIDVNVDVNVEGARPKTYSNFFNPSGYWFDFRDLEMVYHLILEWQELEKDKQFLLRDTSNLVRTLFYYIDEAELTEIQEKILRLKMEKVRNQDIASLINREYGKSYTTNYISTIFRQKIIPAINSAAVLHEQIVENLPFEEEFKKCGKCGRVLLRDPVNFVRKSRAKDGLSSRCKKCDKLEREKNKK